MKRMILVIFNIHQVSGNKRYRKVIITLTVDEKAVEFEVDTGTELYLLLLPVYITSC